MVRADEPTTTDKPEELAKETKEKAIQIRVTKAEKALLTSAAKREGRSLSNWVLWVCLREAQKSGGSTNT